MTFKSPSVLTLVQAWCVLLGEIPRRATRVEVVTSTSRNTAPLDPCGTTARLLDRMAATPKTRRAPAQGAEDLAIAELVAMVIHKGTTRSMGPGAPIGVLGVAGSAVMDTLVTRILANKAQTTAAVPETAP